MFIRLAKKSCTGRALVTMFVTILPVALTAGVAAEQPTSYMPVNITEDFDTTMQRMQAAKAEIEKRQHDLLAEHYDLSDRPATVTMTRGKPIQKGVRVKLPNGATREVLANMILQTKLTRQEKADLVAFMRTL
jgi:cytochrome c1